ncbi:MAG: tRNA-dihydrouridine synthase family protein [Clostridia bacterium]|nr:tRNA-dihydrouridine synthase family protein [Clostridia bacterium]
MLVDKIFENAPTRTILAPMAGYTDMAFRHICRQFGVGLTVTEMISSKAVTMNNAVTNSMLLRSPSDAPCFVQIFGHEPDVMAQSVLSPHLSGYEGVDINMGCPVRKIVGNGDGSALLENPQLASKCISAVKQAIGNKPLSVKYRLGVSDDLGVVDFTKMCKDSGADFVTVHFRTRKQMYAGTADYSRLEQICSVGLPVFANGDICTKEQYDQLINRGAYGVAIGRGAVGKPYLFSQIDNQPFCMDLLEVITLHAQMLLEVFNARVVCNELKKHVVAYLKGMRKAKNTIIAVNSAKDVQQILQLVEQFLEENPIYKRISND